MSRSPTLLAIAAILSSALPAVAQPQASSKCARVDPTADWYRRQREWWTQDDKKDWTNDSLRTMLIEAATSPDADRAAPFPLQLGADRAGAVPSIPADSAAVAAARLRLAEMAKKRSWPTRSVVGAAGTRAAWLIARTDSALAVTALHRMMESGPGEAAPFDVAVAEDQLRLAKGRKQLYASQLRQGSGGKWEPAPTEDLPHVDLRRDAAGLPPLAVARCLADPAVRR